MHQALIYFDGALLQTLNPESQQQTWEQNPLYKTSGEQKSIQYNMTAVGSYFQGQGHSNVLIAVTKNSKEVYLSQSL